MPPSPPHDFHEQLMKYGSYCPGRSEGAAGHGGVRSPAAAAATGPRFAVRCGSRLVVPYDPEDNARIASARSRGEDAIRLSGAHAEVRRLADAGSGAAEWREVNLNTGAGRDVVEIPVAVHVLSYNIWVGDGGYDTQRMHEVGRILTEDGAADSGTPTIIALQELTPRLQSMLRQALGSYSLFQQSECGIACAIGVRPPLGPLVGARFAAFDQSEMGRGVALGRTEWPGVGTVVVGTTHLESGWSNDRDRQCAIYTIRKQQLIEAAAIMMREAEACSARAAILAGDLNWSDNAAADGDLLEGLSAARLEGWQDAYLSVKELGGPKAVRGQANTLQSGGGRFDRCLVWNRVSSVAGSLLSPISAHGLALRGTEPLRSERSGQVLDRDRKSVV